MGASSLATVSSENQEIIERDARILISEKSIQLFVFPNKTNVKNVKVKISRYRPGVAQRMGRGIALLFHHHGTRRR